MPATTTTILLIGHEGHEEVIGTAGEAPDHVQLVDGPDAVDDVTVRDENKVIWLSQTTLSVDETMETVRRLRERFPTLQDPPSDDICYATQNRQVAVKAMAPECQLVIVVGSRNSSNSVRSNTFFFFFFLVQVGLARWLTVGKPTQSLPISATRTPPTGPVNGSPASVVDAEDALIASTS